MTCEKMENQTRILYFKLLKKLIIIIVHIKLEL